MTCPGTYPTVLNGQVYYNDSSTVEFECLSGFYMTGNKRITCTAGVWETAPTCSVIRQYDEVTVFPDWWLIVAAIVGGLLVLACLLCVICYFCCGRADNSVYPYSRYNNGCCGDGGCCGNGCGSRSCCCIMCGSGSCCRCCRSSGQSHGDYSSDGEGSHHKTTGTAASANGVYFVPVTTSPPQGGFFVYNPKASSKGTSTGAKDQATNTDGHSGRTSYSSANYNYGNSTTATHIRTTSNGYAWDASRGAADSKAWKESSNYETHSCDGDRPIKPHKRAKEVKAWLPHANPVRTINTSTK